MHHFSLINTALLSEHVNEKLFMAKMVCNRSPGVTHIAMQNHTTQPLTDEEANALRYVWQAMSHLHYRKNYVTALSSVNV